MIEGPKLLVEWSSRWDEFWTAIGPAIGRSPAPLAGEAPTGLFPLRGLLVSWGAEAILLALAIWLPTKLREMPTFRTVTPPKHTVIYYQGNELPQVQDYGGAQMGRSGVAGGQQAHHESQAIKVARGTSRTEKVVDAPNLNLPVSLAPVANLLAVSPVPGPPPSEGLKATMPAPSLSKNAIVAPPPEVIRDLERSIPRMNSAVVAPPPTQVASERNRQLMGLSSATIIAPAPTDIPRNQSHSVMAMTTPIVRPSPTDVPRDPPPLRGPAASNTIIVPPPVSAPLRENTQTAKLNMPAPAVIAPPPSQVTSDRTVSGASLSDPKVVPPPVEVGGRSPDKRAILGMTAANQVVPPPPSVSGGSAISGGGRGHNQAAGGFGTVLSADNVVPPPPSVSADGSARGRGPARGGSDGTLGSSDVVPPPPSLSGGDQLARRGSGNRGGGMGGPLDAGSVLAPPAVNPGGSGGGKGVVVSSEPGSAKGVPNSGTPGSLAMSPSGTAKSGLGGSGGGAGIGRGTGPGSGLSGDGSGAAKAGTGRGSDPNSHGGTSPYPGPGGAGNGTNGQPPAPGVSIAGGNTAAIINLPPMPGFGTEGGDPSVPGRSPTGAGGRRAFNVTTKGTSRSGGAFNQYGRLPGDVYTTFLNINGFGTVSMQFSDPLSVKHAYAEDLTSPDVLQATLAVRLNGARIMLEGKMNQAGHLHDFHQIFADPGAPVGKVVAAVSTWKFTPALRGNQPVEISVLLGFNIDTR
jgi:hypothetical protein